LTIHRNIFKPGEDLWNPPDQDFNDAHGINPGDVVAIQTGEYGIVNLHNARGITFINEGGPARFKYFSMYEKTKDMAIVGNVADDIVFSSPANFGSKCETTGNLTMKNIKVEGSTLGIQVVHDPNKTYLSNTVNLLVENVSVDGVGMEGMYFGHDVLGGPFITGEVKNCSVKNCGRDGIQVRNGRYNVNGNIVDNVGLNGESYHAHGILFGGNSSGGTLVNNKVSRASGLGVFINGYGEFVIDGNDISSSLAAIFSNNYASDADLQKQNFQRLLIRNNKLFGGDGRTLQIQRDVLKAPVEVEFYSNTHSGRLDIEAGVVLKELRLLWKSVKTWEGVKRYCGHYSDNTWKWL
jgi:hypothetical protein